MTTFKKRGPLFGTNSSEIDYLHIGHVMSFLRLKLTIEFISGIKNTTRCLVLEIPFFPIVKGIGGVSGQNEVFIDSYSLRAKFLGAFYGIEKSFSVVELSRDEFSKNGKILYIWGIFKFLIGDLKLYLIFGPRSVSGPHIWPSGCI